VRVWGSRRGRGWLLAGDDDDVYMQCCWIMTVKALGTHRQEIGWIRALTIHTYLAIHSPEAFRAPSISNEMALLDVKRMNSTGKCQPHVPAEAIASTEGWRDTT